MLQAFSVRDESVEFRGQPPGAGGMYFSQVILASDVTENDSLCGQMQSIFVS